MKVQKNERTRRKKLHTLVREDIWTIRQKGEGKGGHRDCERLGEKEERIEEGKDQWRKTTRT